MLDRPQQHPPRLGEWSNDSGKRPPGRPKFYGYNTFMEIWLAVMEVEARTGMSILQICEQPYDALLGCFNGSPSNYTISGGTLHKRFYEAENILKQERVYYETLCGPLRRLESRGLTELMEPPIARLWNKELRRRLAD